MDFSRIRGAAGAAVLLMASACGGGSGGGGNGGGPPPANQAPHFTSAAAVSLVENATLAYQATASDPNGDRITFAIAGGADSARFTLSPTGLLDFTAPPNFDLPSDADGDNVYLVTLSASDGSLSDTLNLQVTVTNSREGIRVRRVGTGFDQPLYVLPVPGESRVFVLEKTGKIFILDPANGAKTLFMDAALFYQPISGTFVRALSTDAERGLLGMATASDYSASGLFFLYLTDNNGDIKIRRYQRGSDGLGDPRTGITALTIPHPQFNNHYGGWMGLGPDGLLYIATGDGGGAGDPQNNAQNPSSQLGKILRARVNSPAQGPEPLSPAAGNPFAGGAGGPGGAGGDPWVYALGLRNPFRASFFARGLLIGDVGQDSVEEIDMLSLMPQAGGANFGWPFREGTHPYRGTAPAGLIDPVAEYEHGAGPRQGRTITGGYAYRGPIASLQQQYVFADFSTGSIWSLPASLFPGPTVPSSRFELRTADFAPDTGTIDQIASFGEDGAGNLYIVDLDGEIYEVVPG